MGTGNKTNKSGEYLNDEGELDMDCVIVESERVMASAPLNQTKMPALTREMGILHLMKSRCQTCQNEDSDIRICFVL